MIFLLLKADSSVSIHYTRTGGMVWRDHRKQAPPSSERHPRLACLRKPGRGAEARSSIRTPLHVDKPFRKETMARYLQLEAWGLEHGDPIDHRVSSSLIPTLDATTMQARFKLSGGKRPAITWLLSTGSTADSETKTRFRCRNIDGARLDGA